MKATFAGGCFWCMVPPFEHLDGVKQITSGYTGGHVKHPTYEQVCTGTTGHFEAIQIEYDPKKLDYTQLLALFWQQIDPTDNGGQFVDRGSQYRTAIFYHNQEQQQQAETSKEQLAKSGLFDAPIVTEIRPAEPFYPAEEYHQGYHHKCPIPYKQYRQGSGRDQFLAKYWKNKKANS